MAELSTFSIPALRCVAVFRHATSRVVHEAEAVRGLTVAARGRLRVECRCLHQVGRDSQTVVERLRVLAGSADRAECMSGPIASASALS